MRKRPLRDASAVLIPRKGVLLSTVWTVPPPQIDPRAATSAHLRRSSATTGPEQLAVRKGLSRRIRHNAQQRPGVLVAGRLLQPVGRRIHRDHGRDAADVATRVCGLGGVWGRGERTGADALQESRKSRGAAPSHSPGARVRRPAYKAHGRRRTTARSSSSVSAPPATSPS